MSYSDNGNPELFDQLDQLYLASYYSWEPSQPPMDLYQNWAHYNMPLNDIPAHPTEDAYLASLEDAAVNGNSVSSGPYRGNINQDLYPNEFLLSTPSNAAEDYDQLQVPQQYHTHPSSTPSPSYHHHSPSSLTRPNANSTATSLSLNSSPSLSPSPSPQPPQLHISSPSASSTAYRQDPLSQATLSIPFIEATMGGSEESRRRGRRREQNRKAQFIFRQKRKDEVHRLQREVLQLKQRLAAVHASADSVAAAAASGAKACGSVGGSACGAGGDGGIGRPVLCALCKGYADKMQGQ